MPITELVRDRLMHSLAKGAEKWTGRPARLRREETLVSANQTHEAICISLCLKMPVGMH